jgi:predicted Zn-dependent protease
MIVVPSRAGERAVKRLNPRKAQTQSVPVFFDPRVGSSLIGHFAGAISGASIARGVSFRSTLAHARYRSCAIHYLLSFDAGGAGCHLHLL